MNCKGCMYEETDALFCCSTKLKKALNDLMKELPGIRLLAKDEIECKYREDSHIEKARKEMQRRG